MHSTKNIQIPDKNKTEVVCFYNGTKGGVDKMDQMAKQFSTKRKSRRWLLVYFCNTLDLSCLAANLIFKENKPNDLLSHQNARSDFIRDVAGGLAGGHLRRRSQIPTLSRELKFIMQATENHIFKMTPAQEQAEQARSAKRVTPKKQTSGSSASTPTHSKSKPAIPKSKAAKSQKEHGTKGSTKRKQQQRCHYCPWKKDKKVTQTCAKCNCFVCGEHRDIVCKNC
ncbi:PiggyBac transposable element-derived protein 4 [Plakobranchus ocellatus]|uniref:PiggyBac transposable element-derived protein 4 n=1 Tax=Plakobranchus ocellatus TaxID=259542 RepID=A0AAV3YYW7_9GAST|nr:PiggyBac transposable element-derived protein 4 [Plakobranchus ocellatus]